MKVAIQGHPTRGKEVIRILESLGGINRMYHSGRFVNYFYYISSDDNTIAWTCIRPEYFKVYTLEEFEKEFPFKIGDGVIFPVKIGWASGKVTGLTYRKDKLKYEVDTRTAGYHYVEPHKLQLYPMKKERNITLTLDKAKEWYNKGGELKEVALQAFTEKELNPLPRSWEEFCEKYPIKTSEAIICTESTIVTCDCSEIRDSDCDREVCPSIKSAEAHLAMIQLEQLRNCWCNGWKPNWLEGNVQKYVIQKWRDRISIETTYVTHSFLSFPTYELAKEFLECFRDLIEKAGDLI